MKKLLICGDWHGSTRAVESCLEDAQRDKVDAIFQVGDFGVSFSGDEYFPKAVAQRATAAGIPIYFIDGNHEHFPTIEHWLEKPRNDDGHIQVKYNLFYIPRGTIWEWNGKVFAAMGGAASIDRDWRTEGVDYFRDELITANQTFQFLNLFDHWNRGVDYFFTHDCSDRTPWGFQLIPDRDSQRNRQVLDGIIDYVRPAMHFHGHMHKHYEWDNRGTMTYGLNMENERHSRGVLDIESGRFDLSPHHYRARPIQVK
jgi:UDP-2,3-diacylglucosamine pyrophosphatase LpxH